MDSKNHKNTDVIACKLRPASIKATNHRLEVPREEQYKKQITETMAAKCHRDRGRISLSNKKKGNYECNIRDNTIPNQAKHKYSLQL